MIKLFSLEKMETFAEFAEFAEFVFFIGLPAANDPRGTWIVVFDNDARGSSSSALVATAHSATAPDGPSDPGASDKHSGASDTCPCAGALPQPDPAAMHNALALGVSAGVGTASGQKRPSVGATRRVTRGAAFDARSHCSEPRDAPCDAPCGDSTFTRRAAVLLSSAGSLAAACLSRPPSAVALEARAVDETAAGGVSSAAELRVSALAAFNARDFPRAVLFLTRLAALEPAEYRWREALAQCFVDGGGFAFGGAEQSSKRAAAEYTEAIKLLEGAFLAKKARDDDRDANTRTREHLLQIMSDVSSSDVTPSDATIDEDEADFFVTAARLLAGRALAYELAGAWSAAVAEYDKAVATAARGGAPADPLILNQRANALAQSGDWAAARLAYLQSAQGFRDAGGKPSVASRAGAGNGNARGSSPSFAKFRADGVAFASANAALALAELGDLRGAELELRAVSRRAPGLVDARAALAALYWASGRPDDAEREWEFACDNVDVGCAKYRDNRWVAETRRWPPAMAELLRRFLSVS